MKSTMMSTIIVESNIIQLWIAEKSEAETLQAKLKVSGSKEVQIHAYLKEFYKTQICK